MKTIKSISLFVLAVLLLGLSAGCSANSSASPTVSAAIEAAASPTTDASDSTISDGEATPTSSNPTVAPYADLEAISKFRASDLTDTEMLGNLINLLPAITDGKYGQFKQYRFAVQTDSSPFRVILFYEPYAVDDDLGIDTSFSLSKAENNAAILMAYTDNLEKVTLRFKPHGSFDQPSLPLAGEWSRYPESISFTREQLSAKSFNGEDFRTLGDNTTLFNQLLVENESRNEAESVQFMPGPDSYNLAESYLLYMPQLWMDNVVTYRLGNEHQSLDGLIDSYSMDVKPKYFNSICGTIARLYLFQDDAWQREHENDTRYSRYIKIGDFDGIIFALQFLDTGMQDNDDSERDAVTDLYEQLIDKAIHPDFQADCKIKKIYRP